MMYSHLCLAMRFIPVSRALGNRTGISCHAKKESFIWSIKINLSEACQQGSLRKLKVDSAFD